MRQRTNGATMLSVRDRACEGGHPPGVGVPRVGLLTPLRSETHTPSPSQNGSTKGVQRMSTVSYEYLRATATSLAYDAMLAKYQIGRCVRFGTRILQVVDVRPRFDGDLDVLVTTHLGSTSGEPSRITGLRSELVTQREDGMADHPEFEVHRLNEVGISAATDVADLFDGFLTALEGRIGTEGRYPAIVRTKLEETCFFAKKAVAQKPQNQL